jgi:hypothetical protein
MLPLAFWQVHKPPNFWLQAGAFNLSMAIIAGALFGIALRALLLAVVGGQARRATSVLLGAKGVVFLAFGAYYLRVAWPMLIWDRPARFLAAITLLLPALVAAIRRRKGWAGGPRKLGGRLLAGILMFILFVAAALTLLRAGFITLAGDRVPMMVEVTGETRGGVVHHVILWLPDGAPAADLWVEGERVAFTGRAVVFSHRLNAMGFPNLYQFLSVRAAGAGSGSQEFSWPMPHTGPLEARSSWIPLQAAILAAWPRAPEAGPSFFGMRMFQNQSPFYPLTGKSGEPLKGRYLLDLTLEGVPTSRGSSPLEK